MDASFSPEETRFMLLEIIKASSIDVDRLIHFVRLNGVEPDWLNMQIPPGRNLNQCIQVAERLSLPSGGTNRRFSGHGDEVMKRRLGPEEFAQNPTGPADMRPFQHPSGAQVPPTPATTTSTRPPNGIREDTSQPASVYPPRKRGRPSRADKAKRDLRPRLPPHIAPKPPQMPLEMAQPRHSPSVMVSFGTSHQNQDPGPPHSSPFGAGESSRKRVKRLSDDSGPVRLLDTDTSYEIVSGQTHRQSPRPPPFPDTSFDRSRPGSLEPSSVTLPPMMRKDTSASPVGSGSSHHLPSPSLRDST